MKPLKRAFLLLFLLLLAALLAVPALAGGGEYTYTVRFFAGTQGTFSGEEVVTYEGLHYGDRVIFNRSAVTLNDDSKYYVKGIRESGMDNNTVGYTSFAVTADRDYVVAYGVLGDAVAYTVNYLDIYGEPLAPSETYYGNVGDKPVIAYRYIPGYQPRYYNLTRTLSENAAENVFNFIYTAVRARPDEETEETGETGETGGGQETHPWRPPMNPGTVVTKPDETELPDDGLNPEDIWDLDIPLAWRTPEGAAVDGALDLGHGGVALAGTVAIAASASAVLATGFLFWILPLLRRKKKDDEEEQPN